MITTIDGAGRLVVPKALRDALQLRAGQELEISVVDGRLSVEVPATPMRLEDGALGLVAVADREMPTLTADLVRAVLEQVRR